jgi:hypothetical protein
MQQECDITLGEENIIQKCLENENNDALAIVIALALAIGFCAN